MNLTQPQKVSLAAELVQNYGWVLKDAVERYQLPAALGARLVAERIAYDETDDAMDEQQAYSERNI